MGTVRYMRDLVILAIHLLVTFAKLLHPGGVRAVAAESLLLKHQLLISTSCLSAIAPGSVLRISRQRICGPQ
jgi:hypothetical protein